MKKNGYISFLFGYFSYFVIRCFSCVNSSWNTRKKYTRNKSISDRGYDNILSSKTLCVRAPVLVRIHKCACVFVCVHVCVCVRACAYICVCAMYYNFLILVLHTVHIPNTYKQECVKGHSCYEYTHIAYIITHIHHTCSPF